MACLAVVVTMVALTLAAYAWGKHGMFPTRGPFAGLGPRVPPLRRQMEKGNRDFGWGDMGDEPAPGAEEPDQAQ